MKLLLLTSLLISSFLSYSQDKVVLKDGRVKSVKIISINDSTGIIESTVNGRNLSFNLTDVVEYQFSGVWYTKDLKSNKFESDATSSYQLHKTLFRTPPLFSYSKYSISASYGQGIGKKTGNYSIYHTNFAANKRISIEPEIRLKSWFSLKVPVVIGFGAEEIAGTIGIAGKSYNYSVDFTTGSQQSHYGTIVEYRSHNNELAPTYRGRHKSGYVIDDKDWHTKDLIYQIGLAPKFFPLGHRAVEFYLSPSFNYGLGNYNAVDYYGHFDTRSFVNNFGDSVSGWQLMSEDIIVNKGAFSYFRLELLSGIDFNITQKINFGLEMGFSTRELLVVNHVQDRIFISTNGGTPVLDASVDFTPNYLSSFPVKGYTIVRFHLRYKFGGQKI